MSRRTSCYVLFAALSVPAQAYAFSDEERFAQPPAEGGGGGRFFTGSPADGYSCNVCHRGGKQPQVQIVGLPARYQPGGTYNLEIAWGEPQLSHGMELEFVLENGVAAGLITPLEENLLVPAERCTGGEPAAFVQQNGARQILSVDDCGAGRARFRWTAPPSGKVMFAGAIVRSDKSGTVEGDGVTEFAEEVLQEGTSADISSSCAAASSPRSAFWPGALGLALGAWFARRRRAR